MQLRSNWRIKGSLWWCFNHWGRFKENYQYFYLYYLEVLGMCRRTKWTSEGIWGLRDIDIKFKWIKDDRFRWNQITIARE